MPNQKPAKEETKAPITKDRARDKNMNEFLKYFDSLETRYSPRLVPKALIFPVDMILA